MALSTFLSSVVGWLRAGYPEGVPAADSIPLVALLARRLSHDEVQAITAELTLSGKLDAIEDTDIATVISKVTDELPHEQDVERVRARLALGGWPLADPRLG